MDQAGRIFLLTFQRLFYHHPGIAKLIIERCGSIKAAFECDPCSLRDCFGRDEELYREFCKPDRLGTFERDLAWIDSTGGRIIALCDADYPRLLQEIHDPPPVIIIIGSRPDAFNMPCVAMVGSRLATRRGLDVAAGIAEGLAGAGFVVVSGMAFGIDAAAHRGAVIAGGPTIAVLGCGCDIAYPSSNERLARDIEQCGLRVSEFPLGELPYQSNFPQRNRIISGLSLATVVVEATDRSGSLITARFALEQGREVFAVPGPAGSSNARGAHRLIRDGAALVESADDVIALVEPLVRTRPFLVTERSRDIKTAGHLKIDWDMDSPLLRMLASCNSATVDDIVARLRMPACEVLKNLTGLSLAGIVCELPGRRWRLKGA